MFIVLAILLILLIFQALRFPHWGVILIFGAVILEEYFDDYLGISNIIIVSGLIAIGSLLTHYLSGLNNLRLVWRKEHSLLIIYILYLIVTSLDTVFGNENTRNWFLTYIQLLILMLIASNSFRYLEDIKDLMLSFIFFSILFLAGSILNNSTNSFFVIDEDNTSSRYYLISLLFCYYFLTHNLKLHRLLCSFIIICVPLLLIGIVLTVSRTVMLLTFLIFIYLIWKDFGLNFRVIGFGILLTTLMLLVLPNSLLTYTLDSFTGKAFENSHGTGEFNSIQNNIRLFLWEVGFRMLWDNNLLFGIGIGNYKLLITDYIKQSGDFSNPHNTYLAVLFESGILGFFIFLAFIFLSLNRYLHLNKLKSTKFYEIVSLNQIWLIGFIVILIGGMTKHDHYDKLLFLLTGMGSVFQSLCARALKS